MQSGQAAFRDLGCGDVCAGHAPRDIDVGGKRRRQKLSPLGIIFQYTAGLVQQPIGRRPVHADGNQITGQGFRCGHVYFPMRVHGGDDRPLYCARTLSGHDCVLPKNGGAGGDQLCYFLGSDNTYKHFREDYYPKLANCQDYTGWAQEGVFSLRDRARFYIEKVLETPPVNRLSEDQQRAVQAIVDQ